MKQNLTIEYVILTLENRSFLFSHRKNDVKQIKQLILKENFSNLALALWLIIWD